MKTNLPEKVQCILDKYFPNCRVLRVIREWNNVGSEYIYLIVQTQSGLIYAAWNSTNLFHNSDFLQYYSYEDAHSYINRKICIGTENI